MAIIFSVAGCGDSQASYAGTYKADKYFIELFLRESATEKQISDFEQTLRDQPGFESIYFVDQDEELERMRLKMGEDAYLLGTMTENALPASFLVRFSNEADCVDAAKKVGDNSIVANVADAPNAGAVVSTDESLTLTEDMTFSWGIPGAAGTYVVDGTTVRLKYAIERPAENLRLRDDGKLEKTDTVPEEFRQVYVKE